MRAFLWICFLSITFMFSTAFAGDRIVARVGNEAVTQSELSAIRAQSPDISRSEAMDHMIERRLVLAWAAKKKILITKLEIDEVVTSIRERNNMTLDQFKEALRSTGDTVESFRANIKEQLTINKALGLTLSAQAEITDGELQELYLKTYPKESVFEVSHILLSVEKEAPPEEDALVKQNAEEILNEIRNGASFESMASKYSQDGSSANEGGRLGTFRQGELFSELEELAGNLEPGEVGGPVRSAVGYHILLLVSEDLIEPPPFSEVRGNLERTLMMEKEESVRNRWLDELKKTTYIEIFPDGG